MHAPSLLALPLAFGVAMSAATPKIVYKQLIFVKSAPACPLANSFLTGITNKVIGPYCSSLLRVTTSTTVVNTQTATTVETATTTLVAETDYETVTTTILETETETSIAPTFTSTVTANIIQQRGLEARATTQTLYTAPGCIAAKPTITPLDVVSKACKCAVKTAPTTTLTSTVVTTSTTTNTVTDTVTPAVVSSTVTVTETSTSTTTTVITPTTVVTISCGVPGCRTGTTDISRLNGLTYDQCRVQCLAASGCQSYQYNSAISFCALVSVPAAEAFASNSCPGFVIYDVECS